MTITCIAKGIFSLSRTNFLFKDVTLWKKTRRLPSFFVDILACIKYWWTAFRQV